MSRRSRANAPPRVVRALCRHTSRCAVSIAQTARANRANAPKREAQNGAARQVVRLGRPTTWRQTWRAGSPAAHVGADVGRSGLTGSSKVSASRSPRVNPSFTPPQVQHAGDAGGAHLVAPRDAVQRTSTSTSRPAHGDFELDPTCGLNPHGTMTAASCPLRRSSLASLEPFVAPARGAPSSRWPPSPAAPCTGPLRNLSRSRLLGMTAQLARDLRNVLRSSSSRAVSRASRAPEKKVGTTSVKGAPRPFRSKSSRECRPCAAVSGNASRGAAGDMPAC